MSEHTIVRLVREEELPALLALYQQLQPDDPPLNPADSPLRRMWVSILQDPAMHVIAVEHESRLVSTCVLTLIPNLTRAARPYAIIENVVTDQRYRKRGFGKMALLHAIDLAKQANCYKIMLMTSRQNEETYRFYEGAGFRRDKKTAFIQYLN